ncbi:tRNA pseudouridine synthase B [compost metagenome]
MNGFLNVLKPPGMTAHDVVAFMRRKLGTKKIGHAGTLDPLAVGVLPLAVGNATRLLQYLRSGKEYLAEIQFGVETSTADAEGEVLRREPMPITEEQLRDILPRFRGTIMQRPPMVSAVSIGGKRLYQLAREGIEIERPLREVTIEVLELVKFWPGEYPRAQVRVSCSAGTYIRSLAVDMAEALGGVASLAFLLRTRAGDFNLDDAATLDEEPRWVGVGAAIGHMPVHVASPEEVVDIGHGRALTAAEGPKGEIVRIVDGAGELLAMAERRGDRLQPKLVLSK